jgi:hypothetical protein
VETRREAGGATMATPEQQEDLEVCASVYPELRHDWSAAAGLVFILPLARPGASCHFLVLAGGSHLYFLSTSSMSS